MKEKTFNYEERLVEFAGEAIYFCRTLSKDAEGRYYFDQILRATGSAALHFGEAQGTTTPKDFIYKISNLVKELKETRAALKILNYVNTGDSEKRKALMNELEQLIAIGSKMILNKKVRSNIK